MQFICFTLVVLVCYICPGRLVAQLYLWNSKSHFKMQCIDFIASCSWKATILHTMRHAENVLNINCMTVFELRLPEIL